MPLRAILLGAILVLVGCVNGGKGAEVRSTYEPSLTQPSRVLEEDEYLDVGVVVLDPGINSLKDDELVFPEIRRAEATFISGHLAETLSQVGAWGAVRVVPDESQFTDLLVTGKILRSDGLWLRLAIDVKDAVGRQWLSKVYEQKVPPDSYDPMMLRLGDPFQQVYDTIANDMLSVFESLRRDDLLSIRKIAELRFASSFSQEAFSSYLKVTEDGTYEVQRLPAENDPMLERVRNLRSRNYVFIDTLQGYYAGFADVMSSPYLEWRKVSRQEVEAEEQLQEQAKQQMWAGAAAIAAGVAASTSGNDAVSAAGFVGVIAGAAELKRGMNTRNESSMHTAAVEEIGQSLSAEITPRVIELEDRTVRLSGNVEDQYGQWRELMADIYATEIGALDMPNAQAESGAPDNPETD